MIEYVRITTRAFGIIDFLKVWRSQSFCGEVGIAMM